VDKNKKSDDLTDDEVVKIRQVIDQTSRSRATCGATWR
jgi:hypothetical protein